MKRKYQTECTTLNEIHATVTEGILRVAKEVVLLAPRVISWHIRYDKDEELTRVKTEKKRI